MSGFHAHAIRFADLWAVDPHQMVDEIYAPNIHMESMCGLDHVPVENGAQLHELEERLAARIPAHRHELVRVIAGAAHGCLETTVVAPTTNEYAPACVWWWLDGNGQVGEEVGFFDWERRSTDPARSHGLVPPSGFEVDDAAVRAVVAALASGDLGRHLAPTCVVEAVGIGPCDLALGSVEVVELAADGGAVAALVVGRNGGRVWRGTVVLTFDRADRVASVRLYTDGRDGFAAGAVHPSNALVRVPTSL